VGTLQEVFLLTFDWPAVIMVFIATLLLAGRSPVTRFFGFCCMILANGLFFLFGVQIMSTAIMVSSVVFVFVNVYGAARNSLYPR